MSGSLIAIPKKLICLRPCQNISAKLSTRKLPNADCPKKQKLSPKKTGLVVGIAGIGAGIYYMTLDEIEKRKVRVSVGGIFRFLRSSYKGLVSQEIINRLQGTPLKG